MNKRQKEVLQTQLNNEKAVLKKLESNYEDALAEINGKIETLLARQDADMAHVIYQVQYQRALKTQVQSILENLQTNEFETISEYLAKSYEGGFLGTMYDLHGQNIPLIFPIDQEQVVAAIQHETKLSEPLYTALGKDITDLRKKISGEISRGISTGMMYSEIARNVASYAGISKNKAMRIARTEGHRIQERATMDAHVKAKSKGADIVKVWSAALDSRTRDSHRDVDGEIREVEETFSNGLLYPGDPNGKPEEVINCRCRCNSKARWLLDSAYTKWSEDAPIVYSDDGTTQFAIIEAKNYEDFKNKYQGLAARISGEGIPEHEEPKLLKSIDYSNKATVIKELKNFEKSAITESVETACVITKDGEVFKCFGVEDRVFPDFDLKNKLIGASVTHNHPIDVTVHTFSQDDVSLFMSYNLEVLRGCDEKYIYELTRDASKIDKEPDDWMNFENFEHGRIIEKAKELGIGYRRWLNE